ncbi:prophage regulatory protein [Novosphingobium sp. CF614]|uniref:helix-turn-helix transcriptional regulator n=1 Tax=Novosphingobium sp. CF614 TaxID=1884364 RepID=UPI0008E58D70|nr:AlpA family phage regulatory protein [Novosphingobium sp. CF614]SFG13155.1 prophage regulatory protein [Novosphingobium sp. CF614]
MSSYLAFPDLKAKGIPFTRQHLHRLIRKGRFPPPLKLGEGTNRWIEDEIDQWLAERAMERSSRAPWGG